MKKKFLVVTKDSQSFVQDYNSLSKVAADVLVIDCCFQTIEAADIQGIHASCARSKSPQIIVINMLDNNLSQFPSGSMLCVSETLVKSSDGEAFSKVIAAVNKNVKYLELDFADAEPSEDEVAAICGILGSVQARCLYFKNHKLTEAQIKRISEADKYAMCDFESARERPPSDVAKNLVISSKLSPKEQIAPNKEKEDDGSFNRMRLVGPFILSLCIGCAVGTAAYIATSSHTAFLVASPATAILVLICLLGAQLLKAYNVSTPENANQKA